MKKTCKQRCAKCLYDGDDGDDDAITGSLKAAS